MVAEIARARRYCSFVSAVVPLLTRLIAARTDNPGGDETALAELLAGELRARGADQVRVVRVPRDGGSHDSHTGAYVIATWGQPRLLVNAHIDTVPVNAGWTGDPFVARVVGDRLLGLGAADTKGAIAAILCAMDEAPPRDLAVVFSGDEESGGTCMRALLSSEALPEIKGLTYAIVCEPTGLRVGTRHRGIMTLEAHLRGEGGHSSRADQLPRPLALLARAAAALDDWGRAHVDVGPPGYLGMCLNIAKLDGGVAFNVVPDAAHLTASVRPPPGSNRAALKDELVAIVERAAPGAECSWSLDSPAFATRDLGAFRRWLGERAPSDLMFWTEAAILSEAGIDAVVLGPGEIAQAHAPDEWVTLEQLEAARALFAGLFAGGIATERAATERDGSR
jgi:acetylornithine deacetylase